MNQNDREHQKLRMEHEMTEDLQCPSCGTAVPLPESLTPVEKLRRDLVKGGTTLSLDEARFLVEAYYTMQENRIRADAQVRALVKAEERHEILEWFARQSETLEKEVAKVLDKFSGAHPTGQWARSIVGIGPIITAGLLAHIDMEEAPTAGHIWRFAGQDPTDKWEKGEKRPWNAGLKTLCWKIGESFVKVKGNENDVYGKLYDQRKAQEIPKNEAGLFAEQAKAALVRKRIGKDTEAFKWYSQGKLPPGHIHARAKRYAVKLFLAHYHEVAYQNHFGKPAPAPYPIAILGHAHKIEPPNRP